MKISLLEKELKKPRWLTMKPSLIRGITKALDQGDKDTLKKVEKILAKYNFKLSDYYRAKGALDKEDAIVASNVQPKPESEPEPEPEKEPEPEPEKEPEPEPEKEPEEKIDIGGGSEMKIMKFLSTRGRIGEDRLWMQVASKLSKKQQGCVFKHILLDYKLAKIDKKGPRTKTTTFGIFDSVQLDEIPNPLNLGAKPALKQFMKTVTGKSGQMLTHLEKMSLTGITKDATYKPIIDLITNVNKSPIPKEHIAKFILSSHKAGKITGWKSQGKIIGDFKNWIKTNPVSAEAHGASALAPSAGTGLKSAADIGSKKAAQLKKLEPSMWHNVMMKAKSGAKETGRIILKKSGEQIVKHKKKLMAAGAGGGALAIWYKAKIPCDFEELQEILASEGVEMRPMS